MPRVFIGVGSNIEPQYHVRRGLRLLAEQFGELCVSTAWRTAPVGMSEDAAPFINLVAALSAQASVEQTLRELERIERLCGRERARGDCGETLARTLDLDLLLYGELVRHDDEVDVPRSDITEYAFVYEPLLELAPALRHPETGEALAAMRPRLHLAGTDMKAVELEA